MNNEVQLKLYDEQGTEIKSVYPITKSNIVLLTEDKTLDEGLNEINAKLLETSNKIDNNISNSNVEITNLKSTISDIDIRLLEASNKISNINFNEKFTEIDDKFNDIDTKLLETNKKLEEINLGSSGVIDDDIAKKIKIIEKNQGNLIELSTENKTSLVYAINELFQYVSNGKKKLARVITDKGALTLATDSFSTMAYNISKIYDIYPTNPTVKVGDIFTMPYNGKKELIFKDCVKINKSYHMGSTLNEKIGLKIKPSKDIVVNSNVDISFISSGFSRNMSQLNLKYDTNIINVESGILTIKDNVRYNETENYNGELVELINDIDLSPTYINYISSININAELHENDNLYVIFSLDKGVTWKTYYNNQWINIIKSKTEIIEKGLDLNSVNELNENILRILTENIKMFRFLIYVKKQKIDSYFKISQISMTYNTNL